MGILRPVVEMLWGGGDGMARSPPEVTDGAPHATAERLEPVTCCSEPGRHLNRSHRDEPIELARRRHRPRDRAPPAEEAGGGCGGVAGLARALAGRGDPGRAPDHAYRRRGRGRAGRDGFWLARWLRARGIEAYVIHPTSVAVSREHRRAKTDRRDTALLKRVVLGWLRGEPDHCTMAEVPTLEEEDARRPNRERESLVGERTRVVNRIKATLARLGIRGFKPTLRGASERLDTLRTPEGTALPPNTRAELRRDMARLGFIVGQLREIEDARQEGLATQPDPGPHAMARLLARVIGIGIETADRLVHEILSRNLRDRR